MIFLWDKDKNNNKTLIFNLIHFNQYNNNNNNNQQRNNRNNRVVLGNRMKLIY